MQFPGESCVAPRAFNYTAALGRLHRAIPDYYSTLIDEIGLIPPAGASLFNLSSPSGFIRDRYSTSLVHRHLRGEGVPFSAGEVTADGNCLFNSVSLLINGKHDIGDNDDDNSVILMLGILMINYSSSSSFYVSM
jgi:hypothetical protein